jgi:hypothetical protein
MTGAPLESSGAEGFWLRRLFTALFTALFPVLAAALSAGLVAGCMGGSSSTETGSEISLSGRVVDKDNTPISGIAVSLAKAGLTDTTDFQGRYLIEGALPAEDAPDTLVFTQGGHAVAALPVTKWVDSLPDLKIIQRDISGSVLAVGAFAAKIGRVEAVLTGDGIPADRPVTVEVFYNALASHYSGFVYFPGTNAVRHYAVTVNVYDTAGRFTGRSATVPFSSIAGNILVPPFNPGNAVPAVDAGRDTSLPTGALLALRGAAPDSFGGVVTKWEWNIAGQGFRETSSGDTVITLPSVAGVYHCMLRVTDNDGNVSLDTAQVFALSAGLIWTARPLGSIKPLIAVLWTGTQFVAVGDDEGIYTSPDGNSWQARTPGGVSTLTAIARTDSLMVAVGSRGIVFNSRDGANWNRDSLPYELNAVAWTGNLMVAVGSAGMIATSPTGEVWTPRPTGLVTTRLHSVAWTGTQLVAVGSGGVVLTSPNGVAWTQRSLGGGRSLNYVTWTGTQLAGVGDESILTSPDGVAWATRHRAPEGTLLHGITGMNGQLVAVGGEGRVFVSPDGGDSWALRILRIPVAGVQVTPALHFVLWNGTKLLAVGTDGAILTSP